MTEKNQTTRIAADGAISLFAPAGAPSLPPGGDQAVKQTKLTCRWVTAEDGALVMQWTVPEPGDRREETTEAA